MPNDVTDHVSARPEGIRKVRGSAGSPASYAIGAFAGLAPLLGALAPRGVAPLLVVGSLAAIGTFRLRHGRWPTVPMPWAGLIGALIAYCALTLAWTPTRGDGLWQVTQLIILLCPAAFLVSIAARSPMPGSARRILFAAFLAGGLLLLADVGAGLPIHNLLRGRLAFDGDPTDLNRNMVVLVALVWPAMLVPWMQDRRRLAVLLPLAMVVPVALGNSQSAQFGILVGLAALIPASAAPLLTRRGVAALTVVAVAGIVPIVERLHHVAPHSEMLPFSFRHRLDIWAFSVERILQKPVFGWGLEASRRLGGSRTSETLGGHAELMPLHPHNAFLQIWLELGAVGAAISLVILLLLLHAIGRLPRAAQPPAIAAFAASMAMITVAYGIWQSWWLSTLLIMILLVVAASQPERQPWPKTPSTGLIPPSPG